MRCHLEALLGQAKARQSEYDESKRGMRQAKEGILMLPKGPRKVREEKISWSPKSQKLARKLEKVWIILHENGRPWRPGTSAHGVHPRAVEGAFRAHSGLGKACGAIRRPSKAKRGPDKESRGNAKVGKQKRSEAPGGHQEGPE